MQPKTLNCELNRPRIEAYGRDNGMGFLDYQYRIIFEEPVRQLETDADLWALSAVEALPEVNDASVLIRTGEDVWGEELSPVTIIACYSTDDSIGTTLRETVTVAIENAVAHYG